MIVRPLTPDHGWDSYLDLTMRSFGPLDETRLRAAIESAMAAGRCLDPGRDTPPVMRAAPASDR